MKEKGEAIRVQRINNSGRNVKQRRLRMISAEVVANFSFPCT